MMRVLMASVPEPTADPRGHILEVNTLFYEGTLVPT
jgi:hypothetical protein